MKQMPSISPITSPLPFPAFSALEGDLAPGLLIIVDHARANLPDEYGSLGLNDTEFERHIAYDIGIEGVARGLNQQLNVPVVMANFSRLLIDPNRSVDDPTLVMRVSDGALIPKNAYIERDEIERRITNYHQPYHSAITKQIEQFLAAGIVPMLLSLHSFTHNWRGTERPWHAGILWDQDPRFVSPFLAALRRDNHLIVGDNEPYTGKLKGDCMHTHGTQRGLAHALLEIRQDLITTRQGQLEWADRLSTLLSDLLVNEEVIALCRQTCHFGSYAD